MLKVKLLVMCVYMCECLPLNDIEFYRTVENGIRLESNEFQCVQWTKSRKRTQFARIISLSVSLDNCGNFSLEKKKHFKKCYLFYG